MEGMCFLLLCMYNFLSTVRAIWQNRLSTRGIWAAKFKQKFHLNRKVDELLKQ
jgi:hypothetical protein